MILLKIVFEALALTIGGFAITAGVVVVTWQTFKLVHRPELGPIVGFAVMVFAYVEERSKSQLLMLALIFTFVSCLAAWPEGAEWRGRMKLHELFGNRSSTRHGPRPPRR